MYNYYKVVRRKRRRKSLFLILITIAIVFSSFFYYNSFVVKSVSEYSKKVLETKMTASINNAVLFSLSTPVAYNDLIVVQKDNDGNIALLASDSYKTNQIKSSIDKTAKSLIDIDCKKGIEMPFGALTGVSLFSGYGKKINLKILSVGKINSKFISEFSQAGINQTNHSIYLEINAEVYLNLPFITKTITEKSQVLICNAILVGKVPSVYLGNSIF